VTQKETLDVKEDLFLELLIMVKEMDILKKANYLTPETGKLLAQTTLDLLKDTLFKITVLSALKKVLKEKF